MENLSHALNGWALMETIQSLYENGVFEHLQTAGEPQAPAAVAEALGLVETNLAAALLFLSISAPKLITQHPNDTYGLGSQYQDRWFQNVLHFSRGYAPVIHAQSDLLAGRKTYGQDVVRNSEAVAQSSEAYTKDIAIALEFLVRKAEAEVVVDIGCGTGYIGKRLASAAGAQGFGVDTHVPEARDESSSQFTYIEGDAATPAAWSDQIPDGKTVLVASMVMHEFLFSGEEHFLQILEQYKKTFPGSLFLVAEYNGASPQELDALPPVISAGAVVYQYVHPLTHQSVPLARSDWGKLLAKSCVTLVEEQPTQPNATIYALQL